MRIRRIWFEGSSAIVEVEDASHGQSVGTVSSTADSSVGAPPPVGSGHSGSGVASVGSSAPPASDPAASQLDITSEVADTSEVLEVDSTLDNRHLLTTPLDDYTVTEGLLLLAVVFLALGGIVALFRGR